MLLWASGFKEPKKEAPAMFIAIHTIWVVLGCCVLSRCLVLSQFSAMWRCQMILLGALGIGETGKEGSPGVHAYY